MSHVNTGYLENTLMRTNVSSLHKQHHQSKICLKKFLVLNNLHDYEDRHEEGIN